MPPDGVPASWCRVQLLKTVNGLADGTREWRNCFFAAARGLGFETSVLEPCVLVLRNTQQKYHDIVGVAVDDIAGGGDEVWEQAISKLKKRFTLGHWEVGKGENSVAERSYKQQMDPCAMDSLPISRVWTLCLSGTIGRCQLERKNCHEMGALGYLARESRPDLSGPVSILQSRFNKAQVSDIQKTNRVVKVAKAPTDALPVCKIPLDQICLVSYGRCQLRKHPCGTSTSWVCDYVC